MLSLLSVGRWILVNGRLIRWHQVTFPSPRGLQAPLGQLESSISKQLGVGVGWNTWAQGRAAQLVSSAQDRGWDRSQAAPTPTPSYRAGY